MRTPYLFLLVSLLCLSASCTKKVRKDSSAEGGSTTMNSHSNKISEAKTEKLNSIGIPARLPYAADLEAYYLVNCKLNLNGDTEPDMTLMEERGKIIERLEGYEKKYKGKELEEFLNWGSVAANAINNCP
jgi:hypothetical protein